MSEDEDGTGSPTPSSFLIPIPSPIINNIRRNLNVKNPKNFYIKISLIILILISYLILILHTIMTNDEIIISKLYLEEIKNIASTKRINKVLVSSERALTEIVTLINNLYDDLKLNN